MLRVYPQTEFETADALRECGHEALVPYERKYRRHGRHRRRVEHDYPLFPRYVFAGMSRPASWRCLIWIKTVMSVLGEEHRPYTLTSGEVAWVHSLASGEAAAEGMNLHSALRRGDWTRIVDGPLSGMMGYVDAIRGQRASVLMEMLGVWRSVDVPLEALEVA